MSDVHDSQTRSYNMRRIRAKDTQPELIVRQFLFCNGFRYRLHDKRLPGKPDLVLAKYHTVIFVNGCFWHGHEGCKYFKVPQTRRQWWLEKINHTREQDENHRQVLEKMGWQVLVVWECELKKTRRAATLTHLMDQLLKQEYIACQTDHALLP